LVWCPSTRGSLIFALVFDAAAAFGAASLCWYCIRTDFRVRWSTRTALVVASDTGSAPAQTICDPTDGLRGRPDYLLAQGYGEALLIVPLELKPQRRSLRLYESDAVQLGVYLLATRASYGRHAAPFRFERYAHADFCVELTGSLERRLLGSRGGNSNREERKGRTQMP
jgi:hypothetical protein